MLACFAQGDLVSIADRSFSVQSAGFFAVHGSAARAETRKPRNVAGHNEIKTRRVILPLTPSVRSYGSHFKSHRRLMELPGRL